MAPLAMWDETNTGSNLAAQIELYATDSASPRSGQVWRRRAATYVLRASGPAMGSCAQRCR